MSFHRCWLNQNKICSPFSSFVAAMMIEVMAGKSAAIHGIVHDASPFRFSEDNPGVDYHGRLLEQGIFYYVICILFVLCYVVLFVLFYFIMLYMYFICYAIFSWCQYTMYNFSFLFLNAICLQPDMTTTALKNYTVELMEEK